MRFIPNFDFRLNIFQVYYLLLDRKRRKPSHDDDNDVEVVVRSGGTLMHSTNSVAAVPAILDPPRKRIDTSKTRMTVGSITEGSPINPRKTYG